MNFKQVHAYYGVQGLFTLLCYFLIITVSVALQHNTSLKKPGRNHNCHFPNIWWKHFTTSSSAENQPGLCTEHLLDEHGHKYEDHGTMEKNGNTFPPSRSSFLMHPDERLPGFEKTCHLWGKLNHLRYETMRYTANKFTDKDLGTASFIAMLRLRLLFILCRFIGIP